MQILMALVFSLTEMNKYQIDVNVKLISRKGLAKRLDFIECNRLNDFDSSMVFNCWEIAEWSLKLGIFLSDSDLKN